MWLGLGAVAASATTYFVGSEHPSLEAALDFARDDPGLMSPAVFVYDENNLAVANNPVVIDEPFDVEIDVNGRPVPLDRLDIRSAVTVHEAHLSQDGEWALHVVGTNLTLVDCWGENAQTLVWGESAAIVTVLGGSYSTSEHAFLMDDSDLVIAPNPYGDHTLIQGNVAGSEDGAGVHAVGGTVTLDAVFSLNEAAYGGAVSVESGTVLTVLPGSEMNYNVANVDGGAVWAADSTVIVQGGRFEGDYATGHGGVFAVERPVGLATFDALDVSSAYAIQKGGVFSFDGDVQHLFSVTGGIFQSNAGSSGGHTWVASATADFTDVVVSGATTGAVGGVLNADKEATVTWTRGSWDGVSAGAGGALYAHNSTVTVDGVQIVEAYTWGEGGIVTAEGGALTVQNLRVTPSAFANSVIRAFGATVAITDVQIDGAPGGDWSAGAILLESSESATLTRVRLCENTGGDAASSLTVRGGPATLRSSFVWNSGGGRGAVEVLEGGELLVSHTTFAANAARALTVDEGSTLWVERSLFALQAPGAFAVSEPVGSRPLGATNWIENYALATKNGADLGATPGEVAFQQFTDDPWLEPADPSGFDCDATLYLHWDAPTVDWGGSADLATADVDGTLPDYGGYGGPFGWPEGLGNDDQDQDRTDLDCRDGDAGIFPRNDPDADCRCDTDKDGINDEPCAALLGSETFDCDDGEALAFPGNEADDVPGDGIDQDCLGGDAAVDPPVDDTDTPADTDTPPPATPANPEAGFLFGGGGCGCTTSGGEPLGWSLLALAWLVRRRR